VHPPLRNNIQQEKRRVYEMKLLSLLTIRNNRPHTYCGREAVDWWWNCFMHFI